MSLFFSVMALCHKNRMATYFITPGYWHVTSDAIHDSIALSVETLRQQLCIFTVRSKNRTREHLHCLCCSHMTKTGFLMMRLKCGLKQTVGKVRCGLNQSVGKFLLFEEYMFWFGPNCTTLFIIWKEWVLTWIEPNCRKITTIWKFYIEPNCIISNNKCFASFND